MSVTAEAVRATKVVLADVPRGGIATIPSRSASITGILMILLCIGLTCDVINWYALRGVLPCSDCRVI